MLSSYVPPTSWRTGWYGDLFSAAAGNSSASWSPRQHTSTSSTSSGRSKNSLEEQNMRLRLMHLVVFPPETLSPRQSATHPHIISHTGSPPKSSSWRYGKTDLRDPQPPPLILPQQLQRPSRPVKVVLGNLLQHLFRELDVAVLVVVVVVPTHTHTHTVSPALPATPLSLSLTSRTWVGGAEVAYREE